MIKYFTDGRPPRLCKAELPKKTWACLCSASSFAWGFYSEASRAALEKYVKQRIAPVDGGAGELSPAPARRSLGALQAPEEDYVLICPTKGLVEKADWTTDWVNKLNNANNADVPQRRACVTAALAVSENFESKTKNFCCCSKVEIKRV
ncbi:hypothetical protein T4B_9379 [Trichinella pseudospiralis]|nr:hypothetical protein T4B_9379 [Trichinella pseudospiralis]